MESGLEDRNNAGGTVVAAAIAVASQWSPA